MDPLCTSSGAGLTNQVKIDKIFVQTDALKKNFMQFQYTNNLAPSITINMLGVYYLITDYWFVVQLVNDDLNN